MEDDEIGVIVSETVEIETPELSSERLRVLRDPMRNPRNQERERLAELRIAQIHGLA